MWEIFDDYHCRMIWRPVGGWDLRSSPDRAKVKVPIARQDMARFARRLGIPVNPPPISTDPTPAGAASLFAESQGCLRAFVVEAMREEWEFGNDISEEHALVAIAERSGLDPKAVVASGNDSELLNVLERNALHAQDHGVIGVPSFVVEDEIFWGQDRIEFVVEKLNDLRLRKI